MMSTSTQDEETAAKQPTNSRLLSYPSVCVILRFKSIREREAWITNGVNLPNAPYYMRALSITPNALLGLRFEIEDRCGSNYSWYLSDTKIHTSAGDSYNLVTTDNPLPKYEKLQKLIRHYLDRSGGILNSFSIGILADWTSTKVIRTKHLTIQFHYQLTKENVENFKKIVRLLDKTVIKTVLLQTPRNNLSTSDLYIFLREYLPDNVIIKKSKTGYIESLFSTARALAEGFVNNRDIGFLFEFEHRVTHHMIEHFCRRAEGWILKSKYDSVSYLVDNKEMVVSCYPSRGLIRMEIIENEERILVPAGNGLDISMHVAVMQHVSYETRSGIHFICPWESEFPNLIETLRIDLSTDQIEVFIDNTITPQDAYKTLTLFSVPDSTVIALTIKGYRPDFDVRLDVFRIRELVLINSEVYPAEFFRNFGNAPVERLTATSRESIQNGGTFIENIAEKNFFEDDSQHE